MLSAAGISDQGSDDSHLSAPISHTRPSAEAVLYGCK